MMRRPLVGLSLVAFSVVLVNVDTEAGWIDTHRVGLAQLAAGGIVAFLLFGALIIDHLAPTSRREAVSRPRPAPARLSRLSTGSLGHASSAPGGSRRRARDVSGHAPKAPHSRTGPWR